MNHRVLTRIAAVFVAILGLALDPRVAMAQTPPPNDDCVNAVLVVDGSIQGTTAGATTSINGCGLSGLTPDVWYAYAANRTGLLAVTTCGSQFDTTVAVYPVCGTSVDIGCNDDAPKGSPCGYNIGYDSYLTVPATAGSTYFIRVSGFVGAQGTFTLSTHLDTGQPYCIGDAISGSICPCGNNSATAELAGCRNSTGVGARLFATGTPRVSSDSVVLQATNMPVGASCLFFQGTLKFADGYGGPFGDGLRCASGTVVRLMTKTNVNGTASYPGPGEQPVSVRGLIGLLGGPRYYQAWYRNAASFCLPSTFNLTNGYHIAWSP
jgi:hypothetical protein